MHTDLLIKILLGVLAAFAALLGVRTFKRQRLLRRLRTEWSEPRVRDRDMTGIAGCHDALVRDTGVGASLDNRTWRDLHMDDLFALVDRTESAIGQQALYVRLRMMRPAASLEAFDALAARFETDAAARERAQLALVSLSDHAGYDLWWVAQPGGVPVEPWHVVFPIVSAGLVAALVGWAIMPAAGILLIFGAVGYVVISSALTPRLRSVMGAFRQLGPLIAAATALGELAREDSAAITGTLRDDAARLAALRRIVSWISRDSGSVGDVRGLVIEYLNMFLFLDLTALYFAAREMTARSQELLRAITAVGEIDAALAVASYRAGTPGWTKPAFVADGMPVVLTAARHPLLDTPVPNSATFSPPSGLIVTGSNMSGKTTFLRTVGVTAVMAQTIATCLAERYSAPRFVIRSVIGLADDLLSGKSYYAVEVESVVALVQAGRTDVPHLFLFDEMFRGTNAVERISAGEAVLASFVAAPGAPARPHVAIAATHDRELVDLLQARYDSCHFTDSVGPDGLVFDFKIHPGPATSRNAIALLTLAGAPEDLVAQALARAAELDLARGTLGSGLAF